MAIGQGSAFRNEILAALPDDDIKALQPMLTRVSLVSQQVLHERETPIAEVFFVESGIASLSADTLDEGQVEVGLTGWDGFVGASAVLNPDAIAVHRAFVQVSGSAYRMSAVALRATIERSDSLRDRCLRYVDLLMVQTSQVAACNARHNLPERLARWLLMTRDRVDTDHLPVTQEFLSIMLGVRRAGVSLAASALQTGGLIRQTRGRITIVDKVAWKPLHAIAIGSFSAVGIGYCLTGVKFVRIRAHACFVLIEGISPSSQSCKSLQRTGLRSCIHARGWVLCRSLVGRQL